MQGIWSWSKEDRERTLLKLKEPGVMTIMTALKEKNDIGLSNAEIDSLLQTSSQWLIFWDLRELTALGVIVFDVQYFGEPGKYKLTDFGRSVLTELITSQESG